MAAAADSSPVNGGQKEEGSMLVNQAPKYGMLIPSRVFVGGIANNTTESDLRQFFSTYGPIRDCKIIQDRAGVSKGYGFVTFESVEDAEKLMKKEGDHVLFKDRKLNIGPAIRKQQAAARMYDQNAAAAAAAAAANAAMLYSAAGGGLPYAIHPAGLTLLHGPPDLNAAAASQSAQLQAVAAAASGGGAYPMMIATPSQQYLLHPSAVYQNRSSATAQLNSSCQVQLVAGGGANQWPLTAQAAQGRPQLIYQLPSGATVLGSGPELMYNNNNTSAAAAAQQYQLLPQQYSADLTAADLQQQQQQQQQIIVDGQSPEQQQQACSMLYEPTGGGGTGQLQYIQLPYSLSSPASYLPSSPSGAVLPVSAGYLPAAGFLPASAGFLQGSGTFLQGSGSFLPGSGSFLPGSGSFLPGSGSFLPGSGSFTAGGLGAQVSSALYTAAGSVVTQGVEQQQQQQRQSYGVKRVLAPQRQISVCGGATGQLGGALGAPGASLYGMPPVKIIAGQGGQRIVSRTAGGGAELQIIPKSDAQ